MAVELDAIPNGSGFYLRLHPVLRRKSAHNFFEQQVALPLEHLEWEGTGIERHILDVDRLELNDKHYLLIEEIKNERASNFMFDLRWVGAVSVEMEVNLPSHLYAGISHTSSSVGFRVSSVARRDAFWN